MKSGIYAIINTCNNKIYIGQSKSVKSRVSRHKTELKHNKHKNIYLQREFNKYGESCFEFKVIEFCAESEMTEKEKRYIMLHKTNDYNNGFNMTDGGENTVWNDEARKRRSGKGNPMYGKKASEKQREAVRIANLGSSDKLLPEDVRAIKEKLLSEEPVENIAKIFNVTTSAIHKIYRLKNWGWVAEELNCKLEEHQRIKHQKIADRNEKILHDIEDGMTTKELTIKYGVSKHVIQHTRDIVMSTPR